jgi:hypothetical protein
MITETQSEAQWIAIPRKSVDVVSPALLVNVINAAHKPKWK